MAFDREVHERAIQLAPEVLPEYLAAWIVGTLRETHSLPALVQHQDRLALDVLSIAIAKAED